MKKKIIFWAVVVVLLVGLGMWLKYASFGVTVVTILVGLGGIVLGWIAAGSFRTQSTSTAVQCQESLSGDGA